MQYLKVFLAGIIGLFLALSARADLIMPDFADVPTGWVTDRYDPNSFGNVGTFQGRDNVLGIGISAADGFNNRPSAQQSTFYATQGKQHAVSGGVGSVLAADLYISSAQRDGANGSVRTGMWGVMTDGASVSDYAIWDFTNYGGARYRIWDDIAWVDLAAAVVYDAWTSFEIHLTSNSYEYWVNGALAYTDLTINGTTGFAATIMQGYNFCGSDPNLPGAVCTDHTDYWSNARVSTVPEPSSLALLSIALFGIGSIKLLGRRGTHAKMA